MIRPLVIILSCGALALLAATELPPAPPAPGFPAPGRLMANGRLQLIVDYPEEEMGTQLVWRVYCTTNLPLNPLPPLVQPANGSFEHGLMGWSERGSLRVASEGNGSAHSIAFNSGNEQPSGILQTIVQTMPGVPYELTYDVGISDFVRGEQSLLVTTEGSNIVQQTVSVLGDGSGKTVWTNQVLRFTASAEWTQVTFSDRSPVTDAIDLWLDNVQVRTQAPVSDWKLLYTVPATNRTIAIQVQPGINFFALTCSNFWGEQTFSRVISTPPLPRGDAKVTIQKAE